MLASDDRNQEFTGARDPDGILHVTFYTKAVQDNFASEKAETPVFKDETFVKIMIPGRNDLTIDEPVEERHKVRFPRQWAHFKNMTADTEQIVGTPVTEWPFLTRAQAEELRAKKFYTVQQIANCSDSQIQALGMNANMLRTKARTFLEAAAGASATQAHLDEIARKDAELSAMRESIAELTALVKGGGKAAKSKRKPMSEENRKAAGERLAAARARKAAAKAQQPEA